LRCHLLTRPPRGLVTDALPKTAVRNLGWGPRPSASVERDWLKWSPWT